MKNIINEVLAVRNNYTEETRPVGLDQQSTIDIIDVCEKLSQYQVESVDWDGNEMTVDEYIDYLYECGLIKNNVGTGDNSYNWSSPVSNHFNFRVYDGFNGEVYMEFMVHLYGDVRTNYTDTVLLKFDSMEEFYDVLIECNKSYEIMVNGEKYIIDVDIFSDGNRVCNEDWDEITTVYGCDDEDIFDEVVNYLKESA